MGQMLEAPSEDLRMSTDVAEVLSRAWKAVQESGVPNHVQAAALQEAVGMLMEGSGIPSTENLPAEGKRTVGGKRAGKRTGRTSTAGRKSPESADQSVTESEFFRTLAHESGASEKDLRDILQYDRGTVRVTAPTRNLGESKQRQAQTVTALIAGARGYGLGERPVDAVIVRTEVDRKGCYQSNNYSHQHLGKMKGFNAGGRNQIVLTSKWIDEFKAAVDLAHGRSTESA